MLIARVNLASAHVSSAVVAQALASRQTSQLQKCFCLSLPPEPGNGSAQHLLVFLAEDANQH